MKARKDLFIAGMLVGAFMYMFIMANVCSATVVYDFEQTLDQTSDFYISVDGTIAEWTFDGYLNGPDIMDAWLDIEIKIEPVSVEIIPGLSIYVASSSVVGDSTLIGTTWDGNYTGDEINVSYSKDLGDTPFPVKIFGGIENGSFTVNLIVNNDGPTYFGEITEITSSTLRGNFVVPIPGSLILLGSALVGFFVIRRRGMDFS